MTKIKMMKVYYKLTQCGSNTLLQHVEVKFHSVRNLMVSVYLLGLDRQQHFVGCRTVPFAFKVILHFSPEILCTPCCEIVKEY